MGVRHPNRVRSELKPNRIDADTQPEIDRITLPTIKLGRFVNLSPGSDFTEYLDDLPNEGNNKRGIEKGLFSIVASDQLFVEYADLTNGMRTLLGSQARPRTFHREMQQRIDLLRQGIIDATKEDSTRVDADNLAKKEAVDTALREVDHDDAILEFLWLYDEKTSRWGESVFGLNRQPKSFQNADRAEEDIFTYGFPVVQEAEDDEVRKGILQLIGAEGLSIPEPLRQGERPVVPVLRLHCELSEMKGLEPTLPAPPPEIQLDSMRIYRF